MTQPLAGRTVALAEGRQLEELAQLLEKEGATTLRCPMVSIEWQPPFLRARRRPLPNRPRHYWPPAVRATVRRRSSRSSRHPPTMCRNAWLKGYVDELLNEKL